MPTKILRRSDTSKGVTVLFETDIKEASNEKPNTLVVPKAEDIEIPLGAYLQVRLEILQPENRLHLTDYLVGFNATGFDTQWASKLNHSIAFYNAVLECWNTESEFSRTDERPSKETPSELMRPTLPEEFELVINNHLEKNKDRVSTKGDINKGIIFMTYLYAINNVPHFFQGLWLKEKLGMDSKYLSQVINRMSSTYQDLVALKKSDDFLNGAEVFDKDNKPIYFVRHTETQLKGGYISKVIEDKVQDFVREMSGNPYFKIPIEMKQAVGQKTDEED